MVQFTDGQFEIAIATYKRPEFIQKWLEKCYQACVDRNIKLSVYDSSPDRNTEEVINKFNDSRQKIVIYRHVDSETIIGYKPMVPLLESTSEYLWISGDSRYHNFDELDRKVFPYIKEHSIDYICINTSNNYQMPNTFYTDKGKMLHDVFVASTCIGLSIYRTEIFSPIRNNEALQRQYDELYKDNYGFGWLGYFYNVYSMGDYKTLLADVETFTILNKKKTQSWTVRFYGCWVDDLCQIIDNIPDSYEGKEQIPKNTWKIMKLNAIPYCYLARKHGDLNKKKYVEMTEKGYINRITNNPNRIKWFASAPMFAVESVFLIYRAYGISTAILRKIKHTYIGGQQK